MSASGGPPAREYWRVWSDAKQCYIKALVEDSEALELDAVASFDSVESAEEYAAWVNNLNRRPNCAGATDWRPVRCREVAIDD